jgi:hypothetical protein
MEGGLIHATNSCFGDYADPLTLSLRSIIDQDGKSCKTDYGLSVCIPGIVGSNGKSGIDSAEVG